MMKAWSAQSHSRRWHDKESEPPLGEDHLVSLTDLASGEQGVIVHLRGGHGFLGRLAALGFTPGATLSVVRNSGYGPMIVNILDTCIALGRGQAAHVRVSRSGQLGR
jgi:Fe2+ transport system protein FeoA